ncbi:pentapeptide repeat-containing protein [Streptomyces sp. NPDC013457]|uniref:pentapeptide repeat-containing protein n=1 Tax=Streptomyces sp. NPDC013457 TaxID=3364866 RepID=UPI0036F66E36
MDFSSWGDWLRALSGGGCSLLVVILVWRTVVRLAAYDDPHRRIGRRILLVPRAFVRPPLQEVRREVRRVVALRRHQGVASATPQADLLDRLVEADRSARVLRRGLWVWASLIPVLLVSCGVLLGAWCAMFPAWGQGPGAWVWGPYDVFSRVFEDWGFTEGYEECLGWSLLRGCEPNFVPWWSGVESGFGFGMAVGMVLGAWWVRRSALREFAVWAKQDAPLLACLEALAACRDAYRTPAPEGSVLDARVARLRVALQDFARLGLPADADRLVELEEHGWRVATTLHEATGRVLREGTARLPDVVRLLAQLQDRLHESRWLALLDASLLSTAPTPPPSAAPAVPSTRGVGAGWQAQHYLALATAVPAVPALLALVFTAMTVRQASDALRVNEREQVATSYNETVANLGDDNVNVRISSIYALQRMMRESPLEQPAIVEVLSSYIREHARLPKKAQIEAARKDENTRPSDDVQAALNVLGGRPLGVEGERVIDLRRTFLVGADFSAGDFSDADMRGADLTRAYLQDGEFENVWLHDATMNNAFLSNSDFEDSEFQDADLRGVVADSTDLHDTVLTGVDLTGAVLVSSDPESATSLSHADLSGANLTDADLTGVRLRGTDFGADTELAMPAANLTRTNFTGALLEEAYLDGTDRSTAVWDGAVLTE